MSWSRVTLALGLASLFAILELSGIHDGPGWLLVIAALLVL